MSVSDADIAFATDLFAPLGTITSRRMMGGLSIYCAGQIFAITSSDGKVYLKASGDFAAELAGAGSQKFSFSSKDGARRTMAYWTLPEAALDDPELASTWARKALNALQ